MASQQSFPFDDPLFKAAPTLKKAMFPALKSFNDIEGLSACFEVLAFINNIREKPMLDPLSRTVEEVVNHMAESCGFIARDINTHQLNLETESNPVIIFATSNAMPALIYYKDQKPYLYDPATGTNTILTKSLFHSYDMIGFALYKKWPLHAKNLSQLAKTTYKETYSDLKRFLILQGLIGLMMLLQPLLTGVIFDNVVKMRQYSLIDQVFLGLLAASIGVTAFKLVQNYAIIRFQVKSSAFIESALWHRLLSFRSRFFKLFRLGDLHERLVAIDYLQREFTAASMSALCQGFFSLIILLFISLYLPFLGFIIFVATLLFGTLSFFLIRRMLSYHRSITQTNAQLISFLFEAIRSVVKVKTSNAQSRVFQRWLNMELSKMSHFIRAQYLLVYYQVGEFVFPIVISVSLYFLVVGYSPWGQATPLLTIGKFISAQMALAQYFTSIIGMLGVVDQLLHLIPNIERTKPLLEERGEQDGIKKIQTFLKGKITFQNVSFRYDPGGPLVLNTINLTINPGEWVAFVGSSGAGKSTLVKLILGLETCSEGTIFLDDIPLQQLDMPTIRRQVATVLQQTQLLPGSIFDNLHASNPNLNEEEMMSLLKLVAMYEDVTHMPMGLNTVIMGDGRTFSMGQRQRLVLARCLAKPLSVILLDEATSSLDNFSQEVILNTLKQIPITRITVAHRPSTITRAHRVITMERGRIVE